MSKRTLDREMVIVSPVDLTYKDHNLSNNVTTLEPLMQKSISWLLQI